MGFNNTYRTGVIAYTKALITDANIGSGDKSFDKTDTTLETPITGTENNTVNTDIVNGINVEYVVLEGQGNSETIREVEYVDASNNQLLREVIPDTTKTSDLQVTISANMFWDINDE